MTDINNTIKYQSTTLIFIKEHMNRIIYAEENKESGFIQLIRLGSHPSIDVVPHNAFLCGYIGIPETHSLYEMSYSDEAFPAEVHEACDITYSGKSFLAKAIPIPDIWFFGFDQAHLWDMELQQQTCFYNCFVQLRQLHDELYRHKEKRSGYAFCHWSHQYSEEK